MKKTSIILMAAVPAVLSLVMMGCGGGGGGGTQIPPPPPSDLSFQITDSCNNGYTVYYKFFDETDNLVWPSATQAYYIDYGQTFTSTLQCNTGDKICYGASDADNDALGYWGVGVSGLESCTDCCYSCATSQVNLSLDCSADATVHPDHSGVRHLERRFKSASSVEPSGPATSGSTAPDGATCPVGGRQ